MPKALSPELQTQLEALLTTVGTSGDEGEAAACWRAQASDAGLSVSSDRAGNSYAAAGPLDALRTVLLDGHVDEIGFMVHAIDEHGFLRIRPIGGWDAAVAVGQRVLIKSSVRYRGEVVGAVGRDAVHMLEHPIKAPKLEKLWVDIGAKDKADAETLVAVGDTMVLDQPYVNLRSDLLTSRALDDRAGAFVVLQVAKRYNSLLKNDMLPESAPRLVAMASVQEEVGLRGARVGIEQLRPDVAVAVDVCHATDYPGADKDEHGERALGSGTAISRATFHSPVVYRELVAAAGRQGVPYTVIPEPSYTGTNGDAMNVATNGPATGVVSLPLRYMHSPNETLSLVDVESTIELLLDFVVHMGTVNLLER